MRRILHYLLVTVYVKSLVNCKTTWTHLKQGSDRTHFNTSQLLPTSDSSLHLPYRSNEDLSYFLKNIELTYPEITKLYSIGKSVHGLDLLVLEITGKNNDFVILKPNVKLVSGVHGNEPLGKELLLQFILYLVQNCRTDVTVRWLLDNTRIHVLPSMNPDGWEASPEGACQGSNGRLNANGVDLDQDFSLDNEQPQPETKAVQDWSSSFQFVMSLNFHSGYQVSLSPIDLYPESPMLAAPDQDVFNNLDEVYSKSLTKQPQNQQLCENERSKKAFPSLSPESGSMQDFNYLNHGCLELPINLDCCQYPLVSDVKRMWQEHGSSIMAWLKQAHIGVKGTIKDQTGRTIPGAFMKIRGRDIGFSTSKSGEFWRILLPGVYTLETFAFGFQTLEYSFAVDPHGPTVLQLTLNPENTGSKGQILDRVDQAEDRTPIYVQKIPKNVYETVLNGLNLFNLLTLLKL